MMAAARTGLRGRQAAEMSEDPRFANRIRRLIVVSAVALGLITLLVVSASDNAGWIPPTLMTGGWVLMPTILAYSLHHPGWRYLLAFPAGAVSVALFLVSIQSGDSAWAAAGWWMMTAGILVGGSLGMWFWYRLLPVPRTLDQPFSPGRWVLVATHIGLIVIGWVLVLFSVIV